MAGPAEEGEQGTHALVSLAVTFCKNSIAMEPAVVLLMDGEPLFSMKREDYITRTHS